MKTLFYYDPIFLEHDTGPHPECALRLEAVRNHLEKTYGEQLCLVAPRKANIEDASGVHNSAYLESVRRQCEDGGGFLDGDTPISERSFEAALFAAGAVLDGADALMEGKVSSAFALIRPPGHHARPGAGMGFCLINNVAVAADYLKKHHQLERILIVDFDVHHGNGTQEMFYRDEAVFFLSAHRYPFYPGSGSAEEQGDGPGKGTTLNIPVLFGTPPDEQVEAFTAELSQAAESHDPEVILVSAGFDAYAHDPIGSLDLLPTHFNAIGGAIKKAADQHCNGRVLSTLEGGYSLSGLPVCLEAYVEGLD
ncbi:MAG: histone deacetylase family protein [Planctomycetota bacterium]|jgi:acetoin utilization deacetylase AcuC-like enzyme